MCFMGAFVFILLLALPSAAQESGQIPVFQAGTAWVRVDIQAGEGSRLLTDLTKDDLIVYDNDRPQPILYFGHETEPLDLLLLLDVSGSMRRFLEQAASNARAALAELHEGDRVGVMCFSRRTELEQELTGDRGKVVGEIRDAVRQQSLGSGTRINPAILDAAAYMAAQTGRDPAGAPRPGRRAVLILTDNQSLNYQEPDEKVIQALLASDTVLNAIVVGRGERPKAPRPGVWVNPDFTPSDVFRIAEQTGGEALKTERADTSFRDMIESVRTRYSVQYKVPADAAPGSFRAIRVELSPSARRRHPAAWVRARRGYVVK
jgi:VWFA-related protein